MSKRKPDQVITHRIEFQQKERDLLEMAMITDVIGKLGPQLITVLGTLAGSYMASAYLHMFAPELFPAPPFIPDDGTAETAQVNGFITYATNLVERRTEDGWTGFFNPFTYYTDVFGSAYDAYQQSQV